MITVWSEAPQWAQRLAQDISDEFARVQARRAPVPLPAFAKANLPSAAQYQSHWIFVTDDIGGSTPAFSDGSAWRRVSDRAVIA